MSVPDPVQKFLDPDVLNNSIEVIEQATDLIIETSQGIITEDDHMYLRLIAELRGISKDLQAIAKSITNNNKKNEDHEQEEETGG